MDKEWMLKDRLSHEYGVGVESFLQFAIQNAKDPNLISCPCAICGNLKKQPINTIRAHLLRSGMDFTYVSWIWHGEKSTLRNSMDDNDQVRQGDNNFFDEEPIDMVHAAYEYAEVPNKFSKLLEDAEKPLYPGCNTFTKLSALVKLYNLKAKYSWSDTSFTELLSLVAKMLLDDNELPCSLYEPKKSLVALGMDYEKIHACPNDCILYRKGYADYTDCPTCGISRWKMGKNSKLSVGIHAKVLWYFPPIPRFQRMFRNKDISKELTWHSDNKVCDGYLLHPTDAPCWRLIDHKWPDISSEPRNLRLAISADEINPHSSMSSTYSCWPVIMITYNLPPWMCTLELLEAR